MVCSSEQAGRRFFIKAGVYMLLIGALIQETSITRFELMIARMGSQIVDKKYSDVNEYLKPTNYVMFLFKSENRCPYYQTFMLKHRIKLGSCVADVKLIYLILYLYNTEEVLYDLFIEFHKLQNIGALASVLYNRSGTIYDFRLKLYQVF